MGFGLLKSNLKGKETVLIYHSFPLKILQIGGGKKVEFLLCGDHKSWMSLLANLITLLCFIDLISRIVWCIYYYVSSGSENSCRMPCVKHCAECKMNKLHYLLLCGS